MTKVLPKRETKSISQTISIIPTRTKAHIFEEFILWYSCPEFERAKTNIATQKDFAAHYNVAERTLSTWKDKPDFIQRVRYLRDKWAFDRTGTVIAAIYKSAVKGNPNSQKLWMQVFEGFSEKQEVKHTVQADTITVNDIRFLIEQLPTELKEKHYANLRQLLDDAHAVRNAIGTEEGDWNKRPEEALQGETDNDAQDVSGTETNAVSKGYTSGIRANMVRELSTCDHQSTAWRWKE